MVKHSRLYGGDHLKINDKAYKPLLITSFISYILILLWIILLKANFKELIHDAYHLLYEGYSITARIKHTLFYVFPSPYILRGIIEWLVNIILFLPLGIYLPLLFKKRNIIRDIIITIIFILSLEVIELFTRTGAFSLLDVLFNLIGMLSGYLIYLLFIDKYLSINAISIINIVILVIAIPVIIFSIINTINNIELYKPFFNFNKYP